MASSGLSLTRKERLLPLLIFLLLTISVWAILDDPIAACGSCGTVQRNTPAAEMGCVAYGFLLLATFHSKMRNWVPWMLVICFAGHAFLLANLFLHKAWCTRCLLAAGLSAAAALRAICTSPRHAIWMGASACATIAVLQIAAPLIFPMPRQSPAIALLNENDFYPSRNAVTLIAIERPTSSSTRLFASEVEPLLLKESAERLVIIHRSTTGKGMVTPSYVIGFRKGDATVVLGTANYSALRARIEALLRMQGALGEQ